MNYLSENDIRNIVTNVLEKQGGQNGSGCGQTESPAFPVEVSARHVHLTTEASEILFGAGYTLHKKKDLSQPGEFLSEERVKLVTPKGEIDRVAVLGPVRKAIQVELSVTDCRTLGLKPRVNLSGDLTGAADVLLIGPAGYLMAKGSVIVAKAHIHMTPADARRYGAKDGESVSVALHTARPVTLDGVSVRVKDNFALAMHIDFDEANASLADASATGTIIKRG
ncbi:MAG: phosphate propanoyltransferase [Clostridiales bacterium]|nr:phosphate propanoyltransferase [Clostridiales bacterium]